MTKLKYDPELPFVVRIRFSEELLGRFSDRQDAEQIAETIYGGYDTEVIDTTPKPKIPEGAEFICWPDGSGRSVAVWENFNPTKPWDHCGVYYSDDDLLGLVGDAEVTVLVRKEES